MVILNLIIPVISLIPQPWNLLGILPMGFGLAISTQAERQFHRRKTTVNSYEMPTALVTDGLFHHSRNPMYLGFVLVLLGVGLMFGSLTPILVIPVFTAILQLVFIRTEEKMMAEVFGPAWLDYSCKTRRWI